MNILQEVSHLITDVNRTNSSNEKMKILGQFPQCQKILNCIYNEFKQYNVTSDNLKKKSDLVEDVKDLDIYELLDLLENREITGHKAISVCNGFIANTEVYLSKLENKVPTDYVPGGSKMAKFMWDYLKSEYDSLEEVGQEEEE